MSNYKLNHSRVLDNSCTEKRFNDELYELKAEPKVQSIDEKLESERKKRERDKQQAEQFRNLQIALNERFDFK